MIYKLVLIIITLCFVSFFPHFVSAQTSKPLKFGAVYPMTGPTAFVSEGIVLGHRIAAEEIMKAGGFEGRRVEIIVRDDAGNPELNTRYCRELIIGEKVDWIFSGYGSPVGLAALAVSREFKIPTFLIGPAVDKVTIEEWHPYIFRYRTPCTPEARMAGTIVGDEMLKGIKDPRIYWISWDYEYGRIIHKHMMDRIKKVRPDAKIVGEAWPRTGETDYGPFITHMIAVKPHVVANAIWAGGMVSFLKQGSARGLWDIAKLFCVGESASSEYRVALGFDMPEGMWSHAYDAPEWPDNEAHRKLKDLYYNFTGKPRTHPLPSLVTPGYYSVHLVNKAMKKAGTTDKEAVIKAMENIELDTHLGPIRVRDFDHQTTSYYIWGPTIKQEGLPYLVMDPKRIRAINCGPELYTKEEWVEMRRKAGKM
jgi:branched-chain amino acid transport system substrate-binding protein